MPIADLELVVKREIVPSSAITSLPVIAPAPIPGNFGPLNTKNFRFLLEERAHILPLGENWNTDKPFIHTYRYPGGGQCTLAIGDVVQYYPLFKGYAPTSYTPHADHSWVGILADYTVLKPGRKVVKDDIDDIGKYVEVPEGAVENIGLLRLYSLAELKDIYQGKAGDDKLPWKGANILGELVRSTNLGPRDRLLSTNIEGLTLSGVIRPISTTHVGIHAGGGGTVVIRFDQPWLIFHQAGKKRDRTGKCKGPYVSRQRVKVDLSSIEGDGPDVEAEDY
ncbi:unnamed protein product [Peniophora sp. CBMAI 1063]|nr:unnamed protein product [Peniophora sp. CBMAI 1063]